MKGKAMKSMAAALVAVCVLTIGQNALADSYAYRVEYLESTPGGGQYIDTGVVPTTYTTFKGTYEFVAFGSGPYANWDMIAGRQSSGGNYYPVSINAGNVQYTDASEYLRKERYVCKNAKSKTYSSIVRHSVVFNDKDRNVIVDGTTVGTFGESDLLSGTDPASCFLFAARVSGGARGPSFFSAARIYSCEFIDNTGDTPVTLRRFIPVVDLDGRPAMFDEENGKLYHNLGAGDDFIVGPAMPSARNSAPYFVEYLESDGKQWINTGHLVTSNTEIRAGYRFTDETQPQWGMICGVSGTRYYPVSVDSYNALRERYCYAYNGEDVIVEYPVLQRHELAFNITAAKTKSNVLVDGEWLRRYTKTLTSSRYPLYAFAAVNNNNGNMIYPSKARVWHLEILENSFKSRCGMGKCYSSLSI